MGEGCQGHRAGVGRACAGTARATDQRAVIALIVSESIMEAMQRLGVTDARFEEV
ncbi:hypothetical protein D187_001346 [Cystobacter fuscus DSM 2262]|uniref:Uncharacterized protein n=1 Tax=Cystobacter fuscus (strain ATCC 25194 / DSM 2262 / NBRC 100088 / M29) TaxID=1242864 RepID=S9PED6_CYSF2|nr:hypothetical protein D187_001346 [Cystobacter fuscus DSM 2262]